MLDACMWAPEEIDDRIESRERGRRAPEGYTFTTVLTPEWDEKLQGWEFVLRRLRDVMQHRRQGSRVKPRMDVFKQEDSSEREWFAQKCMTSEPMQNMPKAIQDALLDQLRAKLWRHYYEGGEQPSKWEETSLESPLLTFKK